MSDRDRISVYYNSACPVCNAGIERQKRIMGGRPVAWCDVHADDSARREMPGELEFVRERLHVVDASGEVHVGFDAFLAIWRHSPGERWKARVLGMPVIRQVSKGMYNAFARGLYRWNLRKGRW